MSSNMSRAVHSVALEVLAVVATPDSRIGTFRGVLDLVLRAMVPVPG